jgi:hypothetical protein
MYLWIGEEHGGRYMDVGVVPHAWIGEWVQIVFVGDKQDRFGRLIAVSELGITLHYPISDGPYETFYPWAAVHSIRPRPELEPLEE